jgi:hypothetical protein
MEEELKGQDVFFGKGRGAECHVPHYYTDNLYHFHFQMHQIPLETHRNN